MRIGEFDRIETKELHILDEAGQIRIQMDMVSTETGPVVPLLTLSDSNGHERIHITYDDHDNPCIFLGPSRHDGAACEIIHTDEGTFVEVTAEGRSTIYKLGLRGLKMVGGFVRALKALTGRD